MREKETNLQNRVWGHKPEIPALQRLRQEMVSARLAWVTELKASLGILGPHLFGQFPTL